MEEIFLLEIVLAAHLYVVPYNIAKKPHVVRYNIGNLRVNCQEFESRVQLSIGGGFVSI